MQCSRKCFQPATSISTQSFNSQKSCIVDLVRLIDVRHKCIRTFQHVNITELKYAALSYVWGVRQTSRLVKENETRLEEAKALNGYSLPQTLTDSMDLTHALDIDYVWIDVLCILQDDPDDINRQISNVGRIYSNARFTIIALGNDAHAGLPGFRPGTRTFQQEHIEVIPQSENHPGLSLLSTCQTQPTHWDESIHWRAHEVELSKWNTRGWTLQERLLSWRSLIFAHEQVYWVCDGGIFCEESHFEHPDLGHTAQFLDTPLRFETFPFSDTNSALSSKSLDGPLSQLMNSPKRVWRKYGTLVRQYSRRQLSHPGDIYDAFRAISDAFAQLIGDQFHWGHPRSRFEASLSWSKGFSSIELHRRIELTTLKMTSLHAQVRLPSWSWMGWIGPVDFSVTNEKLEL